MRSIETVSPIEKYLLITPKKADIEFLLTACELEKSIKDHPLFLDVVFEHIPQTIEDYTYFLKYLEREFPDEILSYAQAIAKSDLPTLQKSEILLLKDDMQDPLLVRMARNNNTHVVDFATTVLESNLSNPQKLAHFHKGADYNQQPILKLAYDNSMQFMPFIMAIIGSSLQVEDKQALISEKDMRQRSAVNLLTKQKSQQLVPFIRTLINSDLTSSQKTVYFDDIISCQFTYDQANDIIKITTLFLQSDLPVLSKITDVKSYFYRRLQLLLASSESSEIIADFILAIIASSLTDSEKQNLLKLINKSTLQKLAFSKNQKSIEAITALLKASRSKAAFINRLVIILQSDLPESVLAKITEIQAFDVSSSSLIRSEMDIPCYARTVLKSRLNLDIKKGLLRYLDCLDLLTLVQGQHEQQDKLLIDVLAQETPGEGLLKKLTELLPSISSKPVLENIIRQLADNINTALSSTESDRSLINYICAVIKSQLPYSLKHPLLSNLSVSTVSKVARSQHEFLKETLIHLLNTAQSNNNFIAKVNAVLESGRDTLFIEEIMNLLEYKIHYILSQTELPRDLLTRFIKAINGSNLSISTKSKYIEFKLPSGTPLHRITTTSDSV